VNALREKLLAALASTPTANRRLFLFVFVFAMTIGAILISLNSAKPYESTSESVTIEEPSSSIEEPSVFVHVVGEVEKPGIYIVANRARVFDAIIAAGGFTKSADQSTVNLAREVSDGEQVVVMAAGAQSGSATAQTSAQTALISLNRASQLELEALPGVGPTLAGRMIDWRTANGGFKKKEDLLKVSGIGNKMFDGMKDLVTL
jgi:competence protein ComEA